MSDQIQSAKECTQGPSAGKKYHVVCYMRIDPEDPQPMTLAEATHEMHGQAFIQPENIYRVEELESV